MGYFWLFFYPMFANCVHTKTMFVHVSKRGLFFSLNCRKFTVECDWYSKISQNVQKLGVFGKIGGFFSKKNHEIFQNRYMWQIFPECVSKGIFSWKRLLPFLRFFGKNQKKFKVRKVGKYDELTEYFGKKRFHLSERRLQLSCLVIKSKSWQEISPQTFHATEISTRRHISTPNL